MPFQLSDVNKYNQQLTTNSQKRQWVAIANSALEKCEAENNSDCDAIAIRTANGVLKQQSKQGHKPAGFQHATNKKHCSNCQYFQLEHCLLYDYPVNENDTCWLYMPNFSYLTK